jgi:hypothetical protein
MEMPGLKSLFTRLSVRFGDDADGASGLWYRARAVRFDRKFRLLDIELQVAAPDGRLVATGAPPKLRARSARSRSISTPWPGEWSRPQRGCASGSALVLGGSRGLGADITAALALAGCHVLRQRAAGRHRAPREIRAASPSAGAR